MNGYFVRKPENVEIVKEAELAGKKRRMKPTEITVIGKVILSLDEYIKFSGSLLNYWDFLKPYAEESRITEENKAACVLVGAPEQHYIAVCMEGYEYARYVAWPMADRRSR